MKVLHVIPSLSRVHGGPSRAMVSIETALRGQGVVVETATTDDDGPGQRNGLGRASVTENGVLRHYFPKRTEFYKVAPAFLRWLRRSILDYDLIHIHALFSFTSVVAAWVARSAGVPYVVRPLGVLNQYGLRQRRPLLKRLSLRFIEGPILRHAAAVHFTAQAEMDEALATGISMRGAVVPIGIESPPSGSMVRFLDAHPALKSPARLFFLSRVDPKKNLEGLLGALALLRTEGVQASLIVAGSGEPGYLAQLRALAAELGVASQVEWLGHIDGAAKADALAAADVFVLPSHSENFGIAVVEALAAGLPCVLGRGVAVSSAVEQAGAGVAVGVDATSIAAGIGHYLRSADAREAAGYAAKDLARQEYSVEKMGERLVTLYQSILSRSRSDACQ